MILDEPVASLDPEGERAVFELFAQMSENKVILFTTHRYDSIPTGTTIVVLVDGRIAEIGTHEELLQRQRHYWSLWSAGRDQVTRTRAVHSGRRRASAYTPLENSGGEASPAPRETENTRAAPQPLVSQPTWTRGGPAATSPVERQRWDGAEDPGGMSNSRIKPGRQYVR
jgi:ABC-type multidrug transport system ATPase subunit